MAEAAAAVIPSAATDEYPTPVRRFRHEPLHDNDTWFRLVQIETDQSTGDLRVNISAWDRREAPEYATLSYTWGDRRNTHVLLVNDATYQVTENCWLALQQLREHAEGDTHFWIDAICIDQFDDSERSSQVNVMGDIYRMSQTYVSLGQHTSSSRSLVTKLAGDASMGYDIFNTWLENHDDSGPSVLYQGLYDIMNADYWTRVWTMQEFALSQNILILIGDHCLPWRTLLRHFNTMAVPSTGIRPNLAGAGSSNLLKSPMAEMALLRQNSRTFVTPSLSRFDLASTILRTRHRHCSDSRDKIFGILSLAKWPEGQARIFANYSWSNVKLATEVLRRFAVARSPPTAFNAVLEIFGLDEDFRRFATALAHEVRELDGTLPKANPILLPHGPYGDIWQQFPHLYISSKVASHTMVHHSLSEDDTLSIQLASSRCEPPSHWKGVKAGDYLLQISEDRIIHLKPYKMGYRTVDIFWSSSILRAIRWSNERHDEMEVSLTYNIGTLAILFFQYLEDRRSSFRSQDWLHLFQIDHLDNPDVSPSLPQDFRTSTPQWIYQRSCHPRSASSTRLFGRV